MEPLEIEPGLPSRVGGWSPQERSFFLLQWCLQCFSHPGFPGPSALLFHKKNTPVKHLLVSWVSPSSVTWLNSRYFFPGLRVCPPPPFFLFFFLGSFIFLWCWELVEEALLICCVFSSYASPHYSCPFPQFKPFTWLIKPLLHRRQTVLFTFRPASTGTAFIFQTMKAAQSCDEILLWRLCPCLMWWAEESHLGLNAVQTSASLPITAD